MTAYRVHPRRGTLLAAAAVVTVLASPVLAEAVPPLYDGKNTTFEVIPGSILRNGEGFTSGIVTTLFKGGTIKGTGTCSQAACPVDFNGQTVYARRSRLRLVTPAAAQQGTGSGGVAGQVGTALGILKPIDHSLRRGDQGLDVLHLQEALNKNGAGMVIDQNYGRGTVEAVRKFQQSKGLDADGVAGAKTLRALGL